MIKIFNKQEEIYNPKQPQENKNDNQKIEKDYNAIRKLVLGENKQHDKIKIF